MLCGLPLDNLHLLARQPTRHPVNGSRLNERNSPRRMEGIGFNAKRRTRPACACRAQLWAKSPMVSARLMCQSLSAALTMVRLEAVIANTAMEQWVCESSIGVLVGLGTTHSVIEMVSNSSSPVVSSLSSAQAHTRVSRARCRWMRATHRTSENSGFQTRAK
jgi:hypothetical protein